jgi:hypothetical protein
MIRPCCAFDDDLLVYDLGVSDREARLLVLEGYCKSFGATDCREVSAGEASIVAVELGLWTQLMSAALIHGLSNLFHPITCEHLDRDIHHTAIVFVRSMNA